ncbi:reverse transcriptase domain, reverse transcriptase zinc-binding domain protein [Tanacetum coccineum]
MGIPRHAFNLWLIINHKLKTQDRVSIWDYSNVLGSTCPLCEATPDSHEHLFFICPFANSVWSRMEVKAGLGRFSHNIYDIVNHFGGIARRKNTHVVIAKLVVAASAYFIWKERNWRLFKKSKRSIDQVVSCISSSVRMKLLSGAFKCTTEGVLYSRKGYQSQKEQKRAKTNKKRKRQVQEKDLKPISKAGSRPWSRKVKKVKKKTKEKDYFALTMKD